MSREFKIGLFVVVIAVASFFLINYLRGEDIFNREMELSGIYEDTEGLVASAPVLVKGFKAGKVTEVIYRPETGDFKVTCSILKEFAVPVDSRMTICALDIMGGKGVRIDMGASQDMAGDGDMLSTGYEAGLLDGLGDSVGPLLAKLEVALDSLTVTVSGVNSLLTDDNVSSISNTLKNLEKTVKNLGVIASTVKDRTPEIDEFIGNLSAFSGHLEGLAQKADSLLVSVGGVAASLDQSDIEGLVASFKALLESIDSPDGTIGRLLKEDSVYNSVDSLLIEINSLVNKISENPKKYLKISVF